MSDVESFLAAREARANLALPATDHAHRGIEETTTRLVNAAVFRYAHPERGSHHPAPPDTRSERT